MLINVIEHSLGGCAFLKKVAFIKHSIYHVDPTFKHYGLCIVKWIIATAC